MKVAASFFAVDFADERERRKNDPRNSTKTRILKENADQSRVGEMFLGFQPGATAVRQTLG